MKHLILDFKVCRQEEDCTLPYEYDQESSMNVITVKSEKKPFIELRSTDVELMTKTKVQRENDDDRFLGELGSKTEVRRERDDPRDTFLELMTKTFTVRERDDTRTADYQ